MFDTFVMVDWSAAAVPRTGRDSVWICWHALDGERLANPATRHAAKSLLAEWLAAATARGERVLLGFDFPFGYPKGFAARLGLPGPPWRAVWDEIARLIKDDENNANNRFDVAAAFNERISGGQFPFWGCPSVPARPCLAPRHHRGHEQNRLAERRLIDEYMRGAQPCWKLLGAGSVGGQVLTGLPVVRALRDDPRWSDRARIWPYETGLQPSPDGAVVMAEVYPSLWAVLRADDEPKDAAQVRAVARYFAERDRADELAALFAGDPGLTHEQRQLVETEEAWTLGVTSPNQKPIAAPAAAPHPPPSDYTRERVGVGARAERRGPRRESAEEGEVDTAAHMPAGDPQSSLSPRPARGEDGERSKQGRRHSTAAYDYVRDPAEISRRSFALIRQEADLSRFPRRMQALALRLAHAAGDVSVLDDLAWSPRALAAGRKALAAGAPILVDSMMAAAGITRDQSTIICTLRDPEAERVAKARGTTRSATAVELWRPHLAGAVVAIGNAPTALFRLLEMLAEDVPRPALILGFPVGFVGAAEAKAALAAFGRGVEFITLHGRRGGSALAAAAVNALADTA
jgi:precorrin-8X/cobalt-precorrin-8 methylmutase